MALVAAVLTRLSRSSVFLTLLLREMALAAGLGTFAANRTASIARQVGHPTQPPTAG